MGTPAFIENYHLFQTVYNSWSALHFTSLFKRISYNSKSRGQKDNLINAISWTEP